MTLVSKIMVYRALSDKLYILLGLRSPLMAITILVHNFSNFNGMNNVSWKLMDMEKDLMAIIFVMTIIKTS